jgi:hypothetical protein
MTVVPGTRIGAYEVIAAIGAGGMGEVYRARDTRLQREVALKIDERDPFSLVFASSTLTEPLRAHGRWPALAAMMNLPTERR